MMFRIGKRVRARPTSGITTAPPAIVATVGRAACARPIPNSSVKGRMKTGTGWMIEPRATKFATNATATMIQPRNKRVS